MSGIAFDPGTAPAPSIPEFNRRAYRLQGGCVYLETRAVGTIVTHHGDLRTYVSRRRWSHMLRRPVPSWALEEELLDWLQGQGVAWLRIEATDGKEGPAGFTAPISWLWEDPSFEVHHAPFGRQRALAVREWLRDDPAKLERDDDMALFGRPIHRRPA